MKKVIMFAAVLCFVLVSLNQSEAWFFSGKKKTEQAETPQVSEPQKVSESKKVSEAPKTEKAKEEALKARKILAQKKLNELNNTEWSIELSPLSGKGKKEFDTIAFKNNQVAFSNYSKKGFPATNFTLTVQEDGMIVWETMQTSEKSGIAFWRGEMDNSMQTIRGILSYQIDQKNKQDYSFVSTSKKNIPVPGK